MGEPQKVHKNISSSLLISHLRGGFLKPTTSTHHNILYCFVVVL
nr:MAG TPA: hypothetical protein [Caudoviricetes sp.]